MKLGAYTAVLHGKPLPEAPARIRGLVVESDEIDTGVQSTARTLVEASGRSS
jgi:hypothetical protein